MPVQFDVLENMEAFVETQLPLLKPVAESWQPSDFLPAMNQPEWHDELKNLRAKAATLSDEVLVVLVGNIVTEEALPSYQTWLNRVHGLRDETGASDSPWGRWTRGWTAEENRHGELLSRYLYLSGRVDMRTVEITVQNLLKNGFDLRSDNDAYKSLVYASFQERATKISHANTGRLANNCGDATLSKICSMVAGDEARHEEAYKKFFGFVVEASPSEAVLAFSEMMRQKIAMPARYMSDGTERDVFAQFAVVAQRSGIYTTRDYAEVISHLVEYWRIGLLTGLSSEAARSQEYLCGLSAAYMKKAERIQSAVGRMPAEPFAWLFDRCV